MYRRGQNLARGALRRIRFLSARIGGRVVMSNSLNGARARGGHFHHRRAAGQEGQAGPSRSAVALAACLPAALVQGEAHARLGTAPPGVRAQSSAVTPDSGLYAAVQVGRRAKEAPVKVVLCASPECEGPPSYALVCKRALLSTVRASRASCACGPAAKTSARDAAVRFAHTRRAGAELRAFAVRMVSVVLHQPRVGWWRLPGLQVSAFRGSRSAV
jgi:hypothetical protein